VSLQLPPSPTFPSSPIITVTPTETQSPASLHGQQPFPASSDRLGTDAQRGGLTKQKSSTMLAPQRERSRSFLGRLNRSMTNLVLPRAEQEAAPPLPGNAGRERKTSTTLSLPQRLRRMTSASLLPGKSGTRQVSSGEVEKFRTETEAHLSAADYAALAAALEGKESNVKELLEREIVVEGKTIPLANYLTHVAEHLYLSQKKGVRNMLPVRGGDDGFSEARQRAIAYSGADGDEGNASSPEVTLRTGKEAYVRVFEQSMLLGDVRNAEYGKILRRTREDAEFWNGITSLLEENHDAKSATDMRNAGIDIVLKTIPKFEDVSRLVDEMFDIPVAKDAPVDVESFLESRLGKGLAPEEAKALVQKANDMLQQDAAYRELAVLIDASVQARMKPGVSPETRQKMKNEIEPLFKEFEARGAELNQSLAGEMKQELTRIMAQELRDAGWPEEAVVRMRDHRWQGRTLPNHATVENNVKNWRDDTFGFDFLYLDRLVFSKLNRGDLQKGEDDKRASARVHKSRAWFRDLLTQTAEAVSPVPAAGELRLE
jgi:hypothetical protein